EYLATRDWSEVKSRALQQNLLSKGSRSRISKLLRAIERRILQTHPPLNRPEAIARFLTAESRVPAAAKTQLVFTLAVRDDIALGDAFRELVLPELIGKGPRALAEEEILRFLDHAAESRPEVR